MANCFNCNEGCFGNSLGCFNTCRCVRTNNTGDTAGNSCRCCNGNSGNNGNGFNCCNNQTPTVPPAFPNYPNFPFPPQRPLGLPAYAQFSSTAATLTTGTPLALTPVLNSGNGFITSTGNTVTLTNGVYEVSYSLNATTPAAGGTVTVTPTLNGTPLTQYASTTATTAAEGINPNGSFLVSASAGDTLAFTLTSTAADPLTAGTFNVFVTKIDQTQSRTF